MIVESYLNGILPRSDLALQLGSSWLRGRETKEAYNGQREKETLEYIKLQHKLDFDYIVDRQLFWDDFLRPVSEALGLHPDGSNANENPVTRQIYTNTFYRKPLIRKRPENASVRMIDDRFIKLIEQGKRKIILPSPFAIAYLSDGMHKGENNRLNNNFVDMLFDIAKILNQEAKRLQDESNISFVQFNDPCMLYAEEANNFWNEIAASLETATKGLSITTSLHLYNGDASRFSEKIFMLPVDRIGVDAYTTDLSRYKQQKFGKFLELGIINSKNSLVEQPEALAKYARQIIDSLNPEGLALVPNRPLELVPQHIAVQKMESLSKAKELLKNEIIISDTGSR